MQRRRGGVGIAERTALLRSTVDRGRRPALAYAIILYFDAGATLEDLREAVTTFEDIVRIARRVLGAAHPLTTGIEKQLQNARVVLRARETPSGEA